MDINTIREDQASMREIITIMKNDINTIREDQVSMKNDITTMKNDFTNVKHELKNLKNSFTNLKDETTNMSDDASTMMKELARNMATNQDTLERAILELCGSQAKSDYTIKDELYNARKRRLNAGIHSPYAPLHILVHVGTGEPIREFPLNVAAISTMTVALIRPIMAALNNPLPDDSGEDASQRLFRMEIGLVDVSHGRACCLDEPCSAEADTSVNIEAVASECQKIENQKEKDELIEMS